MPQQLTVENAETGQEYAGGIWLCSKKLLDLQQSWQEPLLECGATSAKKPCGKDTTDGGWWAPSFACDTVLSGNRSNPVEFSRSSFSGMWVLQLSRTCEGSITWTGTGQLTSAGRCRWPAQCCTMIVARRGMWPQSSSMPGVPPQNPSSSRWVALPSPIDTTLSLFVVGVRWWAPLGKNWRPDGAPRNLTRLWAFKLD